MLGHVDNCMIVDNLEPFTYKMTPWSLKLLLQYHFWFLLNRFQFLAWNNVMIVLVKSQKQLTVLIVIQCTCCTHCTGLAVLMVAAPKWSITFCKQQKLRPQIHLQLFQQFDLALDKWSSLSVVPELAYKDLQKAKIVHTFQCQAHRSVTSLRF